MTIQTLETLIDFVNNDIRLEPFAE